MSSVTLAELEYSLHRTGQPDRLKTALFQVLLSVDVLPRNEAAARCYGRLLLKGTATAADVESLRQSFESREFFIAEQLGISALYAELWAFSSGPISDDYVWHTFEGLKLATADDLTLPIFNTVKSLTKKINSVVAWN